MMLYTMKLLSFSCLLVCLFVLAAVAAAPQMAVVVTYLDKNTPDWVLDQAKRAIREARGTVTHEYTIIKSEDNALVSHIYSPFVGGSLRKLLPKHSKR